MCCASGLSPCSLRFATRRSKLLRGTPSYSELAPSNYDSEEYPGKSSVSLLLSFSVSLHCFFESFVNIHVVIDMVIKIIVIAVFIGILWLLSIQLISLPKNVQFSYSHHCHCCLVRIVIIAIIKHELCNITHIS